VSQVSSRPCGDSIVLRRTAWLCVFAIGAAIRVTVVLEGPRPSGDAWARYEPLARGLLAGHGFSKDTQPPYRPDGLDQPGYPLFLAAIYGATGGSRGAVVAAQLVLEAGTIVLMMSMAAALGLAVRARRAALAVALVCPFLPIYSAHILTEALATFATAATLAFLIRAAASRKAVWWCLAGLAGTGSLLVRADSVIAFGLMALAALGVAWRNGARQALLGAGLCVLVACAALAPWALRNQACFGELRPLGRASEQIHSGYVQWLDTWLVDPRHQYDYWWHVLDQNGPHHFPDAAMPDSERERAEAALGLARAQGSFDGAPAAAFSALAREAREARPFTTRVLTPLRRMILTWLRLPSCVRNERLKVAGYGLWAIILLAMVAGLVVATRERRVLFLVPLALIAGRSALPLLSGIANEPRYVIEALPACFLFAALLYVRARAPTRPSLGAA
jgi:hypothetical protein